MKTRDDVKRRVQDLRIEHEKISFDELIEKLGPELNGIAAGDFIRWAREAFNSAGSKSMQEAGRRNLMRYLGVGEFPRAYKRGSGHKAHYEIVYRGVTIDLGPAGSLLMPTRVEAAFLGSVDWSPNLPARAKWKPCAVAIAEAAEPIPTGTEDEETAEWVSLFVAEKGSAGISTKSAQWHHLDSYGALEIDGVLYINSTKMLKDLAIIHKVQVSREELARRLSRLGFERKMLPFRVDDGIKTVRTWRAPLGFDVEATYTGEAGEVLADDPDRFKAPLPS